MAPYNATNWQNFPITSTPLSAANLNKLTNELKAQAFELSIAHTLPTWNDGAAPALTDATPFNEIERVIGLVATGANAGAYSPSVWRSGWEPARSAARLNQLELQAAANRTALDTPPPPTGVLRDRPPGYPNYVGYTTVNLGGAGYREFPDTQDVLLNIGDYTYDEGISIVGGRNVVIRGGRITAIGLTRAYGVGMAIWPRTANSHYYIEGVRIRPDKNPDGTWKRTLNDGFAMRGPLGKVTIQNCLVGPCAVKQGYDSTYHPDVFQFQAQFDGDLRVHRFTGYTEYTGVMCSALYVRSQNWSHVNMVATGYSATDLDPLSLGSGYRGHTAFGIYDNGINVTLPGVTFEEFYWARDPLQSFQQGYSPVQLVTQKGGKYGKPKNAQNQDYDYVTEAMVALPYVSPGYA